MWTGRTRLGLLSKTGCVMAVAQFVFVIIQDLHPAFSVPNTSLGLFSNRVLLVTSLGLGSLVRSEVSDTTIW
ncbi:MAG: hypothetical protein ACJAZO_004593 [Myxococcota bacterium]|jgi:hypothetical protein